MPAGTTDKRWVDLDGAVNARDLGGLEVAGGGRTAPGVLLRSDNLQGLTADDVDRLVDEHGVRVVVDLRTGVEVELEGPGPLAADGRVEIRHRSLMPETGDRTDVAADAVLPWQGRPLGGDPAESPAVRSYLGYLRDRPDSIVAAGRGRGAGRGAPGGPPGRGGPGGALRPAARPGRGVARAPGAPAAGGPRGAPRAR